VADYIRLVGWLLFCLTVEVFLLTVDFPVPVMVERLLSKSLCRSPWNKHPNMVSLRLPVTDRVAMEDAGFDLRTL
jgi:hypothetical protein